MKYALCNELFGEMEFAKAAALAAEHGFHGLELAPFTVFGDFSPAAVRKGVDTARRGLADNSLAFAGFHWLLVKPEGIHITSGDAAVRERSWGHIRLLLEIAGELGGGALVLGSPKQRASRGIPHAEALKHFRDGLESCADAAERNNSVLLIEPLAAETTDIVTTMREAAAMARAINRPGISGMWDFHNMVNETEPFPALIERYRDAIRHVHLNTMTGGWPAADSDVFADSFAVLKGTGYAAWASLEIFSVPERPEQVLADVAAYLRRMTGQEERG